MFWWSQSIEGHDETFVLRLEKHIAVPERFLCKTDVGDQKSRSWLCCTNTTMKGERKEDKFEKRKLEQHEQKNFEWEKLECAVSESFSLFQQRSLDAAQNHPRMKSWTSASSFLRAFLYTDSETGISSIISHAFSRYFTQELQHFYILFKWTNDSALRVFEANFDTLFIRLLVWSATCIVDCHL